MSEKGSVLIVDDNESLCKTLTFILNRNGYTTTTAHDGPEAIKQTEETSFDLTLMDIRMPLMDGVEAYKKIKRLRPKAAVVMMTAYSVEELVGEAREEGAFGIIYKPLDIEKAVSLIERAKEARHGALIMVVDDDPGTCTTLKNILTKKDNHVGVAGNGEEAINMAQKRAYDIIFIDMKLPTINGLETYLAIKEIHPEVVAIMMTAYRQEMTDLVEEALNNTAYAYLYKPLDIEEMLRLIDEIWERKQKAG